MTGSKRVRTTIVLVIVGLFNDALAAAGADNAIRIELSNDRAFPESITASSDGTLYISSPATGGITRVPHGATRDESWIKPGAFDTRSTFGVLADNAAHMLWVCSNDVSAFGVPGPSAVSGSYLKGFDLRTGEGKVSAALPGAHSFCNDIAIGPDGSLFVTNSLAPQLLRLKPGGDQLEVWLEDQQFAAPSQGGGLDGIAFGSDGHLYVNTFTKGELFRIEVHDGAPGKVTKLQTSRPLVSPDGLRAMSGLTFVMVEGGGTLDRVLVAQDQASIETLAAGFSGPTAVAVVGTTAWVAEGQLSHLIVAQDQASIETLAAGFSGPTAVAVVGTTAWVAEGQLSHLFDPAKNGSPRLPFHIKAVPLGK